MFYFYNNKNVNMAYWIEMPMNWTLLENLKWSTVDYIIRGFAWG